MRSSREETLAYFTPRLTQAPRDVDFALGYVQRPCAHARRAGGGAGRPALQMRRAVGAARCAAPRLCRPRPSSRPAPSCPSRHGAPRRPMRACRRFAAGSKFRFDAVRTALGGAGAGAAVGAGRAGRRDPAAGRRQARRRRDRRRPRRPLQRAARRRSRRTWARCCAISPTKEHSCCERCPTRRWRCWLELTHRCPLHCPYCSNPLKLERVADELADRELDPVLERGGRARRAAGAFLRRRADGAARPAGAGRAVPRSSGSTAT